MPTVKPTKPSITLPTAFGTSSSNVKTQFTPQELIDGYSASIPQVLDGGNLNYMIDAMFQYLTWSNAYADWYASGSANTVPYINSSNQLDYATPVFAGSNNTFTGTNTFSGTTNIKSPNISKSDSNLNGGTISFNSADNEPNAGKNVYISRYNGSINFGGGKSDGTQVVPFAVDIQNNQVSVSNMAVAGNATFNETPTFKQTTFNVLNVNYGTNPSSDQIQAYAFVDKNNNWVGEFGHLYGANGYSYKIIAVRRQDLSDNYARLEIGYTPNQEEFVNASSGVKWGIARWSVPNYETASETGLGFISSGHTYTAVMDGTLHLRAEGANAAAQINLLRSNSELELVRFDEKSSSSARQTVWIPVKGGQTYKLYGTGTLYAFFCALSAGA